jgi:radical SAM protein with 4Fe4S-binding SPASM domain
MIGKWRVSEAAVIREEDFGGVVFDRRHWHLYKLNRFGYQILEVIGDNELAVTEIVTRLDPAHEWPQSAFSDVEEFLNQLRNDQITLCDPHLAQSQYRRRPIFDLQSRACVAPISDRIQPRVLSAPVFMWWDVTARCNLRCKQCYSDSGKRSLDELSTAEALDLVNELAEAGVFWLYLLGGEPLLREDLFEILQACSEHGIELMISTNGWYVSEEIAERLVSVGVHHVRVSLDGATARTHDRIRGVVGSFDRAIKAVGFLRSAGIPFLSLSPTFMEDNIGEAGQLIDLAHKLQVDEITCGQVCPVGRGSGVSALSTESVITLRQTVSRNQSSASHPLHVTGSEGVWNDKPHLRCVLEGRIAADLMGCKAGRDCAAIGPSGVVRACLLYDSPLGDLRKISFSDLWSGRAESISLTALRAVKEGCLNCRRAVICAGPCPMSSIVSVDERCRYVAGNFQEEVSCGKL